MDLEKQVCSLELAQKLKELGVEQDNYFVWVELSGGWEVRRDNCRWLQPQCATYTVGELGELLPNDFHIWGVTYQDGSCWYGAAEGTSDPLVNANTEADVKAKLLIWHMENSEQVNDEDNGEENVCSVELAKELCSLGVIQNSCWVWVNLFGDWQIRYNIVGKWLEPKYAAFSVDELKALLPDGDFYVYWYSDLKRWYGDLYGVTRTTADTEVNVYAKLLIWYLENEKQSDNAMVVGEPDAVSHPEHYTAGGIKAIDFIEANNLGFHLGNAVACIVYAGKENPEKFAEDIKKACWYLQRAIQNDGDCVDGQEVE